MRDAGPVPSPTKAAALIPSAWAIRTNVVTVGDFVPRSMSEIIEDEMPLRAASIRKLKPAASRRCLTARPVRRLTSSSKVDNMSSIAHGWAIQARSRGHGQGRIRGKTALRLLSGCEQQSEAALGYRTVGETTVRLSEEALG